MDAKPALILFLLLLFLPAVSAQEDTICTVYFSGIGCPHCAHVDPVLFPGYTDEMAIIKYEIYQHPENAPLLTNYNDAYAGGLGVPLLYFSPEASIRGDSPILDNLDIVLASGSYNPCPTLEGMTDFHELDFSALPGSPDIWLDGRVLRWDGGKGDSDVLRSLLSAENLTETLGTLDGWSLERSTAEGDPYTVPLSGTSVSFEHAISYEGWILAWDGDAPPETDEVRQEGDRDAESVETELTFTKLIGLAAVDAVNPCALAVLTLLLIGIITYNPQKKRKILQAGLAFCASVFVIYIIYGLILIKIFQLVQLLTSIRLVLLNVLAVIAIILGLLNIRDFFRYKPGGVGTEMPLMFRPKVKKILTRVTSPRGAAVAGAIVTLFLLPCTIGPYVIASGILSFMDILSTLPWLLVYNVIFVLPMVVITFLVYGGIAKVEDVSGWKDKHIRNLHLAAGILMILIGIAMLAGWV